MWKKIKSLLDLEQRLLVMLQRSLDMASDELKDSLVVMTKSLARQRSEFNERLSRIEVLFAEELEAKAKARDERVKKKRLGTK